MNTYLATFMDRHDGIRRDIVITANDRVRAVELAVEYFSAWVTVEGQYDLEVEPVDVLEDC